MKNINLLIVASDDMDGTDDNFNLPSDIINGACQQSTRLNAHH
jgi:hypothetical protein